MVARFFLALVFCASSAAAQQAMLRSAFVWEHDDPVFGGFSGIEMMPDGAGFYALSDRGWLAQGRITRSGGQITDVVLTRLVQLHTPAQSPLPRALNDSEGLALTDDGQLHISFEWTAGLRQIAPETGLLGPLQSSDIFGPMQSNAALEAVAAGPDGTLYTMPERSGRADWPFPVFALQNGHWRQAFTIPRRGPFLLVGADIGPDGRLYLLERDFIGIGFRTRVRRFALDGTGAAVVLETPVLTHDNLEGISVWQDGPDLVMTLISDDNFRRLQQTQIVEYLLTQN